MFHKVFLHLQMYILVHFTVVNFANKLFTNLILFMNIHVESVSYSYSTICMIGLSFCVPIHWNIPE